MNKGLTFSLSIKPLLTRGLLQLNQLRRSAASRSFFLILFAISPRPGVACSAHSGRVAQTRQYDKLEKQPNANQSDEPCNVVPHNHTYFCIGSPAFSQAAVPPAMLIVCG